MSAIRLCTLALIATSSLAACSSYQLTNKNNMSNTTHVTQVSEAITGQVTTVIMQDREQQKVTILAQDGQAYTVFISKSNFGQQNAYQMQKLAIGDSIEVIGEQSQLDDRNQITVRAMPYVLRKIIVADHQVDCVGVGPQLCWLTKIAGPTSNTSDWEYRYSGIQGFAYEPNYEYTLLIKNTPISNPPADASSIRSELIEIIEKKRTKT